MKKLLITVCLLTIPTIYVVESLVETLYGYSIPKLEGIGGDRGPWHYILFILLIVNLCLSFIVAVLLLLLLNLVVIKSFPNKAVSWWQDWQEKISERSVKSGLDRSDFLTHLRKNMPDWHVEKAEVLAEKCWKRKRYINPMQYCEE